MMEMTPEKSGNSRTGDTDMMLDMRTASKNSHIVPKVMPQLPSRFPWPRPQKSQVTALPSGPET